MIDMLDRQESTTLAPSSLAWQETLGGFRARAKKLFEAQQERIRSLEELLREQIDGVRDESNSPTHATSAAGPGDQEQELRFQLAHTRKLLNVRADELKALRSQLAATVGNNDKIDVERLYEEISGLRMERDQLVARVADAEHRSQRASTDDANQVDELRQRFEKAVQEIRELKTKNVAIESQAESSKVADTVRQSSGFDWEEQKRKIMEELCDPSSEDGLTAEERLSIEGTIRISDEVVARKDREIADLQAVLNERGMASGLSDKNTAIAEVLDRDELILSEREKLASLQEEWRDKLRQAEIDVSVERAKLARERAELESRLQATEAEREAFNSVGNTGGKTQQSSRWLSRLGLKEDDN